MYSTTFAMTVIIGIALIHLFFGFATAKLMGYGPKRWSDIRLTIVRQPISLRRPRLARYPKKAPRRQPKHRRHSDKQEKMPVPSAHEKNPDRVQAKTDAESTPPQNAPRKIVLPTRPPPQDTTVEPPEETLSQQLEMWREGDSSDETPSMSGILIDVEDSELDIAIRALLSKAAYRRVRAQLRTDRRLLQTGDYQCVWFSSDIPPDQALMPVERIRQMLTSTRFHHQGTTVSIKVVAAVVAAQKTDSPTHLLKRLHASLQYALEALEKQQHATCLDTGEGPEGVEPHPIEIQESDCDLDGLQ